MGNVTREGIEQTPQSKVLDVIEPAAEAPQENLIPPWRDRQIILVRALLQARSARGSRKPLRIESPNAVAYATRQRRSSADAYTRVRRYLVRLSLRALNDLNADGTSTPEPADLAVALERVMREHHRGTIRDQAQGEPRPGPQQRWRFLESESLERCCAHAADAALSAWSPRYIVDQTAAGQVGGSLSRRTSTWGWEEVERVASLLRDGARPVDVVELLRAEWSPRTVETMVKTARLMMPIIEPEMDLSVWR